MSNRIEVEEGSGNVFADIGLPNPEERLAKADLAIRIDEAIRARRLTQSRAAITPPRAFSRRCDSVTFLSHGIDPCHGRVGYPRFSEVANGMPRETGDHLVRRQATKSYTEATRASYKKTAALM
jgi:hypothetical protein